MSGGLGVLTSDPQTPVVTETSMGADLLETLKFLTKFVVQDVGHHLGRLAVLDVSLSVQEPVRDLVLTRVLGKKLNLKQHFIYLLRLYLHDGDELLNFLLVEFSSSSGQRNVSLLQTQVGVTTSNTLKKYF